MFYLDSVPVKITVHDPVLKKDRVAILFMRHDKTGWGIFCDDGTYVIVEEKALPGIECYDLRNSFVSRSYLCISRKVHRPIYEECKAFSKKS
jgi:hypothetical protein